MRLLSEIEDTRAHDCGKRVLQDEEGEFGRTRGSVVRGADQQISGNADPSAGAGNTSELPASTDAVRDTMEQTDAVEHLGRTTGVRASLPDARSAAPQQSATWHTPCSWPWCERRAAPIIAPSVVGGGSAWTRVGHTPAPNANSIIQPAAYDRGHRPLREAAGCIRLQALIPGSYPEDERWGKEATACQSISVCRRPGGAPESRTFASIRGLLEPGLGMLYRWLRREDQWTWTMSQRPPTRRSIMVSTPLESI